MGVFSQEGGSTLPQNSIIPSQDPGESTLYQRNILMKYEQMDKQTNRWTYYLQMKYEQMNKQINRWTYYLQMKYEQMDKQLNRWTYYLQMKYEQMDKQINLQMERYVDRQI